MNRCLVASLPFFLMACTAAAPNALGDSDTAADTAKSSKKNAASGGTIAAADGAGEEKTSACVPVSETETTCDGKDDDCNGVVDDVDVGADGICDCLNIGLIGKPGYYGSNDFQAWLASKGTTVTRVDGTDELDKFDMVILDWLQRSYTADETAAFGKWLDAGHGALALSGFEESYDVARPNAFLELVGLSFTSAASFSGRLDITDFAAHPVTTEVKDVTFYGGSAVRIDGARGKQTAIATRDGKNVGVAVEDGNARMLAWGDEWIEFDSEWKSKPDITRFWSNTISYLAPRCSKPAVR